MFAEPRHVTHSTLAHRPPALILLDDSSLDPRGPAIARQIRTWHGTAHIPLILLTSSVEDGYIDEAFAAGADDYIVKPFASRIMLARISSMIRASTDRARVVATRHVEAELSQMRSDLQSASVVQRDQVTKLPVQSSEWTISGAVVPCQHIGGDLLYVVDGLGGSRVVIVLDVAGHGAAAALVAASALAELRNLLAAYALSEALSILNVRLGSAASSRYVCVCAIALSGERVMVVNAGLPPVCLIRDGEIVQIVEASGTPPGMFDDGDYAVAHIAWHPGDRLVVVSDGLTESLGLANDLRPCLHALALLTPGRGYSTEDLMARIRTLLAGRHHHDDATLVIIDRAIQSVTSCNRGEGRPGIDEVVS
jgi:CheY-like chemotaxis protein